MPLFSLSGQYIIALGASAGGIEAIFDFFDHTLPDEVSYIIIQHLSADHQSHLAQLLAVHSKLSIYEVTTHMKVERNKIYVIPPQHYLTIRGGELFLISKQGHKYPHRTIDTFFEALAADQGNKAIGVILSGMGNDGSKGVIALKKAGGLVLVQDPVTAAYPDMPAHALATGIVDKVLATHAMPEAILRYIEQDKETNPVQTTNQDKEQLSSILPEVQPVHSIGANPDLIIEDDKTMTDIDSSLTEAALSTDIVSTITPDSSFILVSEEKLINEENTIVAILDLLKNQLPFDFSGYKRATIFRRIRKRMAHHHLAESDAYLAFLKVHPLELQVLAQEFLISVTSFFRDPDAFDILEKETIPSILTYNQSDTTHSQNEIKVWVAGCATGEEAYSIAMLIVEYLERHGQKQHVKIFATDLDKNALAVAARGVYPISIENQLIPSRLERFFVREEESYRVIPQLRHMLVFAHHDLGTHPPYCHMDLISCRNLLIYMNSVLQHKIFYQLHFGLKLGGYLFLGASESISTLKPYVQEVSRKWKIYQKTQQAPLRLSHFSLPVIPENLPENLAVSSIRESAFPKPQLGEAVAQVLLEESGQAAVCINEAMQVVQSFGPVEKYLLPKVLTFQLPELLPEPLAIAFGAGLHRINNMSQQPHAQVTLTGIVLSTEPFRSVRLKLQQIKDKRNMQSLLVLFSEEMPHSNPSPDRQQNKEAAFRESTLQPDREEHPSSQHAVEQFHHSQHTMEYIVHLEEELKNARERLLQAHEKLDLSRENMLSFNEELLSVNEELQSANEEQQSVNEEIQTINNEYQLKIRELTELNDDLNNYFRSNQNGQLFVDSDLRLKKFSPAAVQHINMRESDIGRPLGHITTNIRFETLLTDIQKVIASGQSIVREAESVTGNYYQVMTVPYIRLNDQKVDGAIITFYDISHLKKTQEELQVSNQSLLRINAELDTFVYAASHDLLAPLANIEGLILLLQDNKTTDKEKHSFYEMIEQALKRFRTLVKELAYIGNMESQIVQQQDLVNWAELFEDIRLSILDQLNATQATIKTDFQVAVITVSRKSVRSILYNLISNAVKYRSVNRKPEILIRTESLPGFQLLTVQDNGKGMDAEQLPQIFSLYHRIEQHIEGQGIGLYLVKKLIYAAGGKIEVESSLDKGTIFRLYFKSE
ncbi:chemotaxis protein CheB [Xanthocytophaga agilis]|uniref:histidine kinase n=1 Tax=Xanthocytophaga agilis TaxID=3048010 RepID=A0AAE3QWL4_9BACT|nr:chemotaxis protein CheB [Xanthocytophaga agilis]MDJ1499409.1 chemotaxis protein CheB [Xanthocytophaga agilis]